VLLGGESQCDICSHCFLGVVVSCCVFLCLLVGRVWVCCVVDLLLFLSGVCLSGGCGLRETHSGLSQSVSDSSTVTLFFLGCVFLSLFSFIATELVCNLCVFFSLLLCLCSSLLCCDCGCGCGGMWVVLLLSVFDFVFDLCCFVFVCVMCW